MHQFPTKVEDAATNSFKQKKTHSLQHIRDWLQKMVHW